MFFREPEASGAYVFEGDPRMSLKRDDKPFAEESAESAIGSKFEQERSTAPVSTRVGRNAVDIDVPALRHLVDTMKAKLIPDGNSDPIDPDCKKRL
jgi:hypothetical protein